MGFIKEIKNEQNLGAYENYLEAEIHSLNNKLFDLKVTEEMYSILHEAVTEALSKPVSPHIMIAKLKEALNKVNGGQIESLGGVA